MDDIKTRVAQARAGEIEWTEVPEPVVDYTVREYQTVRGVVKPVQVGRAKRRKTDARIWAAMSEAQADAVERIAIGFDLVAGGLGYAKFSPERVQKSQKATDDSGEPAMVAHYWNWAKTAQKEGYSVAAALDWIAFNEALSRIDANRRKKKGFARANLMDCLSLYAKLRGWI